MGSFVAFFDELGLDDVGRAGGKGANLGHLAGKGYRVPPGFCVLVPSYDSFLFVSDLEPRVLDMIGSMDFEDLDGVEAGMERVRDLMESSPSRRPSRRRYVRPTGRSARWYRGERELRGLFWWRSVPR